MYIVRYCHLVVIDFPIILPLNLHNATLLLTTLRYNCRAFTQNMPQKHDAFCPKYGDLWLIWREAQKSSLTFRANFTQRSSATATFIYYRRTYWRSQSLTCHCWCVWPRWTSKRLLSFCCGLCPTGVYFRSASQLGSSWVCKGTSAH